MDMYTQELSFNVGTCSPGLQHQAGDDPPLVVNALVALQAMKRHGRLLCFAKLQCSANEHTALVQQCCLNFICLAAS